MVKDEGRATGGPGVLHSPAKKKTTDATADGLQQHFSDTIKCQALKESHRFTNTPNIPATHAENPEKCKCAKNATAPQGSISGHVFFIFVFMEWEEHGKQRLFCSIAPNNKDELQGSCQEANYARFNII